MYCLSCLGSVLIIVIAPGLPVLHQYNLYYWHLYVSVHSINRAIPTVSLSWCYQNYDPQGYYKLLLVEVVVSKLSFPPTENDYQMLCGMLVYGATFNCKSLWN